MEPFPANALADPRPRGTELLGKNTVYLESKVPSSSFDVARILSFHLANLTPTAAFIQGGQMGNKGLKKLNLRYIIVGKNGQKFEKERRGEIFDF